MACLTVRTKPYPDKDSLAVVCYRCGTTNQMLASECSNCKHPVFRCFCSFDCLPLVEFEIAPELSSEKAEALIKTESSQGLGDEAGWKVDDQDDPNVQTMNLDEISEEGDGRECVDFTNQLMAVDAEGNFERIIADERMLRQMDPGCVFICKYGPGVPR